MDTNGVSLEVFYDGSSGGDMETNFNSGGGY